MDKMEAELKAEKFLKFQPDTVQSIRMMFNLDQPGRMEEAIDIIEEWIQKQDHFMNKDFDRGYIERLIINNKGLLERVKQKLDKKCTVVNLSKLIGPHNIKEFKHAAGFSHAMMPRATEDFKRIIIRRANEGHKITSDTWLEHNKMSALHAEYFLKHDYSLGYHFIGDLRNIDVMDLISSLDLGDMREHANVVMETNGIRLKSVHLLTPSKMAGTLVNLIKQFFSSFKYEIYVHSNLEDLYKYIPKELLPSDYGGKEDTLDNLTAKFIEELSSEEHMKHMRWVCEARTDESKRPTDKFNEQYMGLSGTFRSLAVD